MLRSPSRPLLGLALAIAITTAMDATGLGMFSALPLWPLAGLFWFLQRFSRRDIGLTLGSWRDHGWAVGYPLVVLGTLATAAALAGQIDADDTDWGHVSLNLALMGATTIIGTILTEEGFFRGWLWAAVTRALGPGRPVLLITSVGFTLWHVSAVTLMEEFALPLAQVPVYLLNVLLLGLIWGMMRQTSGSLVVASVSHGVWNGLTYMLFGFGTKVGALGITDTAVWGPETGWLGAAANAGFLLLISRRRGRRPLPARA